MDIFEFPKNAFAPYGILCIGSLEIILLTILALHFPKRFTLLLSIFFYFIFIYFFFKWGLCSLFLLIFFLSAVRARAPNVFSVLVLARMISKLSSLKYLFCRMIWSRAMATKSKKDVEKSLSEIFDITGNFEQIQTDDKYFARFVTYVFWVIFSLICYLKPGLFMSVRNLSSFQLSGILHFWQSICAST